jgi:hypothetical protein
MQYWSLLFLILLSGCAAPPAHRAVPATALFADAAFQPPAQPVHADDLFSLSPAMRAYLRSAPFASLLRSRGAAEGLVDALYRKGALQIRYDATSTRTAAQTFDARAGNCLSLVVMTAAFARELGLQVRLQSVGVDDSWSRANGLYLVSTHINLAIGPPPKERLGMASSAPMLVVDFVPQQDAGKFDTLPLDDEDVAAMFLNNRAAEALVAGRIDDAYWWARAAIPAHSRPTTRWPSSTNAMATWRWQKKCTARRSCASRKTSSYCAICSQCWPRWASTRRRRRWSDSCPPSNLHRHSTIFTWALKRTNAAGRRRYRAGAPGAGVRYQHAA